MAIAERKRDSEEARHLRQRESIFLSFGLALRGIVFLTALVLLAFSSSISKHVLAKQRLLITGGFLGYLTGRAAGGKSGTQRTMLGAPSPGIGRFQPLISTPLHTAAKPTSRRAPTSPQV